ncbi:hypothetical protein [Streptomyces thermolilacinus]|nr:hypothetical protein [Streptomyces thermolilacinus]
MHPVLEAAAPDGFALWPVAHVEPYGFLPLSGELAPYEVGTALMSIAAYNDPAAGPGRPADALGSFLHGLLTAEGAQAPGGMRVTDSSTGVAFLPGCCNGLEEWRDWYEVLDGGSACFGHDPDAYAERLGDTVRLTADTGRSDGSVIDVPVSELRRLLEGAERDLAGFLALADGWISRYLPGHAEPVKSALAHALGVPASAAVPPRP